MNFQIRLLMAVNTFLYRLTGGRLGSRMAGQDVLLLHTTGRKSGKAYITPTNYYRDGPRFVLVASNWGQPNNPAWYYNLMHMDTATVQVKGQTIRVKPRLATEQEYARLWEHVTSRNKFYIRYQEMTRENTREQSSARENTREQPGGRKIPLVILTPQP